MFSPLLLVAFMATVTRDLMNGTTRVFWSGNDESQFPRGRMQDHEQMSYEVQDSKPEASKVHGEGSTTVELQNRTLVWRIILDVRSDPKNFYYHFERHLAENGKEIRTKNLGRHDSSGSSVKTAIDSEADRV